MDVPFACSATAPTQVLQQVWQEVWRMAAALGHPVAGDAAYDPEAYRLVYASLLARRRLDLLSIDTVLPTAAMSVYDYAFTPMPLVPAPDEVNFSVPGRAFASATSSLTFFTGTDGCVTRMNGALTACATPVKSRCAS
mgnify:CR=1 FL=1